MLLLAVTGSSTLFAQTMSSPNNQWTALPYPSVTVTDPVGDQQTGQGEADLVGGYHGLAAVYTRFYAGATSTTGTIAFRLRVGGDSNPAGFKSAALAGVDANGDGALDVFVGVDNSGAGDSVRIWRPGTGANNSPATTSLDSAYAFTYTPVATNYNWQTVTAVSDPAAGAVPAGSTPNRFDLNGATGTDYFVSFSVPFADLITVLNSRGITGITSGSILNYVAGTASNANSLNQDLNGISGGTTSTATYTALGIITPPVLPTGNRQPVAQNNSASTAAGTVVNNINVLGNDSDPDGDALSVTAASSPNGTVTINGNGTLNFMPSVGFSGGTTISYTISDGRGGTATASVAVTVIGPNVAPVAVSDSASVTEDTALNNINVLVNDSDANGDALTVTSASSPNGTVTINGNGTLNFMPSANFSGPTTTISYTISDGNGGTATASVAVTVTAVNDSPVAVNNSVTTAEDTAANNINVLGNDSDLDGDTLTVTSASSPNGTVTINGDGTLNFMPSANFSGPTTTISYTISDGNGGTASATVAVTVTAVNDSPVAVNNSVTTAEDTASNNINVLGNDTDADGDALTVTSASSPNGTVTINPDGTLNFTPSANFSGPTTTISYTISDGNGGTASATVAVSVTAVNDPPVAANNSVTTAEDTAANNINVLGNDSDVDGDALSVTIASSPNGTVTINPDGTLNFTPTANFSGPTTTISYTISDGNGGTASATVAVSVTAVNDSPVAVNNSVTTAEDTASNNLNVLGNDTDADGDALSVTSASSPNGTVTINPDGTLNFTPTGDFNGIATITYAISDGNGGTASSTVSVTVNAVNDAPVVGNDTATATENTALNNLNVLGNDGDPDGDTLTVTSASSPNGTVTINLDGTLNFTPATNFNGTTTISYTVSDGHGGTTTGSVAVNVTVLSHSPVAVSNTYILPATPAPYTFAVSVDDSDPDNDPLTIISTTNGTFGTVTTDGTNVIYTPMGVITDSDTFTYTISDGNGGTATATVRIIVELAIKTLATNRLTPGSGTINGRVNPNGVETTLSFEYSQSPTLAGAIVTPGVPVGNGVASVAGSFLCTNLWPNTRYYYRVVSTSSAGVFYGEIESFLTPLIIWGTAGASVADGVLDATRIPNSTSGTTYTNVSGRGYDLVMSTSSLSGNGYTGVTGASAWWLGGTAPNAAEPAKARFRFFDTGTQTPHGIMGVRFQIDDAEQMETLMNFSYFDEAGVQISVPWNSPIFKYSHAPSFSGGFSAVENGAVFQNQTQSGKWVDINLAGIFVSGFEFQYKRSTSAAGTIIMGPISGEREVINVVGNFTPQYINTNATGFAPLPDYRPMAVVSGSATSVTLTQVPAPGTLVPVGKMEVKIFAEDADSNHAHTGFNVIVRDKTGPVITPRITGSPNLLASGNSVLTAPEPLPDYTRSVSITDSGTVTRYVQSPPPGTITSAGVYPVIITAYDNVGNVGAYTFQVTVNNSPDEGSTPYTSVAAKGGAISGSGTVGIPVGAVFNTFGVPSINDSRVVAFAAKWTFGTRTGKSIFVGNPVQPVTTLGQPAPEITGAIFKTFQEPVLNNAGTQNAIAFRADVSGPGITSYNNTGVWTDFNGELQLLAREGNRAAGTDALFQSITSISMVSDEVIIVGTVIGGSTTSINDCAAWRWTASRGLELIIREGQMLPGNKMIASFQMIGMVPGSLGHGRNHLDNGFYTVRIKSSDATTCAALIDFTGASPLILPIVHSGKPGEVNLSATAVGIPSGNAFGAAAFSITRTVGPAVVLGEQQPDNSFINSIIVSRGSSAVDSTKWSTFSDPVINAENKVAWLGRVSGATTTTDQILSICAPAGTPTTVAREGSPAPGTAGVFHTFNSIALPDGAHGPIFAGTLRDGIGGVWSSNDNGLWATASDGSLQLIFREGDAFGTRIVKSIQALGTVINSPGQSRSFNSTGNLIALLTFSDGSQSIITVTIP